MASAFPCPLFPDEAAICDRQGIGDPRTNFDRSSACLLEPFLVYPLAPIRWNICASLLLQPGAVCGISRRASQFVSEEDNRHATASACLRRPELRQPRTFVRGA